MDSVRVFDVYYIEIRAIPMEMTHWNPCLKNARRYHNDDLDRVPCHNNTLMLPRIIEFNGFS